MPIDMEAYRTTLASYGDMRVLAAWVAGSHAHGLADEDSDVDLKLVAAPSPRDILLQQAGWVDSHHDPDVTVMTPIPLLAQLVKGSPNMLESLTLPTDLVLMDHGLLETLRPYAARLTTGGTVSMALGNARANMHQLDKHDLEPRRRRKLVAETMRLLQAVEHVSLNPDAAWPARLDVFTPMLRAIRSGDMTITPDGLLREYRRTVANAAGDDWRPRLDEQTKTTVENIIIDLMRRLIDGRQETSGMEEVAEKLSESPAAANQS